MTNLLTVKPFYHVVTRYYTNNNAEEILFWWCRICL